MKFKKDNKVFFDSNLILLLMMVNLIKKIKAVNKKCLSFIALAMTICSSHCWQK